MSCKKCQIRCQKFRSKIRSFCTGKTRSVPIGIARNTVNFFGGGKPAGKSFFGGAARCNAAAKYFFQKLGLDKTKKCAIIIYIMKKCGGGMIRIAIVEDEREQSELLSSYLERYAREHTCRLNVVCYGTAAEFLAAAAGNAFDVVFMDIELPDGNGMEAVRKMRETDKRTLVIFVTNLAQYAVKGYEVRAFDFIVKPIAYYNFILKFSAALDSLELNRDIEIWIKSKEGRVRLYASHIVYVEVQKHYLTYHTKEGDYTALGSIGSAAEQLKGSTFAFCNRCYLVNLKYVSQVTQTEVMADGKWLVISRHKRADFLKELNDFLAGGN